MSTTTTLGRAELRHEMSQAALDLADLAERFHALYQRGLRDEAPTGVVGGLIATTLGLLQVLEKAEKVLLDETWGEA